MREPLVSKVILQALYQALQHLMCLVSCNSHVCLMCTLVHRIGLSALHLWLCAMLLRA